MATIKQVLGEIKLTQGFSKKLRVIKREKPPQHKETLESEFSQKGAWVQILDSECIKVLSGQESQ